MTAPMDEPTQARSGVMRPNDGPQTAHDEAAAHVGDLTQLALRRVLADFRSGHRPDANVAAGLREACDAARKNGLRAEEMLLIVKQTWWHLSDTQVLIHRDAVAALDEVITLCIKEFYRPRPPAVTSGDDDRRESARTR